MQSDVLSTAMASATGNLRTAENTADLGPCRIKGIYYSATVTGSVTLRDGGATGPVICTFPVTPSANGLLWIPDNGLWFRRGTPHMTINGGAALSVTYFYA